MQDFLLASIVLVLLLLLPQRRQSLDTRCERLMAKLPDNQLEPAEPLLEPIMHAVQTLLDSDRAFQAAVGGVKGGIRRLAVATVYLRLTGPLYDAGLLPADDAAYIWSQAALQLVTTTLTLPEAALCKAFKPLPHFMSYLSFRSYRALVLRCEVSFASRGAPECVSRIKDLL